MKRSESSEKRGARLSGPRPRMAFLLLSALAAAASSPAIVSAADRGSTGGGAADQPYLVEWVYKVKWGHADEFFDLFKKYQLKILEREKQLGYVLQYTIYHPGLHTSEDERWDYRVVIEYRNILAPAAEHRIERELFPDRETFRREEDRRWELVEAHWDLPLRIVDPNAPDD